jgi:hypothetical protein
MPSLHNTQIFLLHGLYVIHKAEIFVCCVKTALINTQTLIHNMTLLYSLSFISLTMKAGSPTDLTKYIFKFLSGGDKFYFNVLVHCHHYTVYTLFIEIVSTLFL